MVTNMNTKLNEVYSANGFITTSSSALIQFLWWSVRMLRLCLWLMSAIVESSNCNCYLDLGFNNHVINKRNLQLHLWPRITVSKISFVCESHEQKLTIVFVTDTNLVCTYQSRHKYRSYLWPQKNDWSSEIDRSIGHICDR